MKKVKLLLGFLMLLSTSLEVFGQQDPHYTQYMYNMSILNPAYAGARGTTTLTFLGRTQWVGLEGAPRTGTFSINSPIGGKSGLGLSIINDQIGPATETNVYADYSYTLRMGFEGRLAFGLKAGFSFLDVTTLDLLANPDPLNAPVNQTSPNFGAGVYYYTDTYYLGFSAPNFLNTKHIERNDGVVTTASEETHYFLTGGYVFDVSPGVLLKPSTMIKGAPGAPISIDLSANVLLEESLELGLSYRLGDSMSAMIGVQATPDFRIGYAYDYTTSNFGDYNSGSHEIILIYEFNIRSGKCPRFF